MPRETAGGFLPSIPLTPGGDSCIIVNEKTGGERLRITYRETVRETAGDCAEKPPE